MFEIKAIPVKLESVNARAELHGKESKPAFDLRLSFAAANDALIEFHPELRTMLYKKNDQPDLVDQADPEALTSLRFPKMGGLKWDFVAEGYAMRVAYGIGGPSDIALHECKVHKFSFQPQNGGTVQIGLTVIAHPETADVGRLCEMIQQTVEMDLTPPEPATLQELFKTQEKEPA